MKSTAKLTRNLIYVFIVFSIAGFTNPSISLAKSNELSSIQIISKAKAEKDAKKATKKAATAMRIAKRAAARAIAKATNAKNAELKASEAAKAFATNKITIKALRKAETKAAVTKKATEKAAAKAASTKKAADQAIAEAAVAKKTAELFAAIPSDTKKTLPKKTASKKGSQKKTTPSKNSGPETYVDIDSLRDLGIDKGYVCFRIKAYSNNEVSGFSQPACTNIKNSENFRLAWASGKNSVIGYQIYFGDSAKQTENFLADIK